MDLRFLAMLLLAAAPFALTLPASADHCAPHPLVDEARCEAQHLVDETDPAAAEAERIVGIVECWTRTPIRFWPGCGSILELS